MRTFKQNNILFFCNFKEFFKGFFSCIKGISLPLKSIYHGLWKTTKADQHIGAALIAGSADLSAFADSGIIADYASGHVSAMVAEGLVKGNADGTINPLGNTTRAEAAVIMQRILNK